MEGEKIKKNRNVLTYWLCGPLRTLSSFTNVPSLLYYLSRASISSLSALVYHSQHPPAISTFQRFFYLLAYFKKIKQVERMEEIEKNRNEERKTEKKSFCQLLQLLIHFKIGLDRWFIQP
jgi:hypothetical protein